MKTLREIFGGGLAKGSESFALMAGQTAAEVCQIAELQEEAKAHLSGNATLEAFFSRLVRAKLYADATRFLAYALPERQAVWWAYLCVRSVPACCVSEIEIRALEAAEAWVRNPAEPSREAALVAGGEHTFEPPGAAAAWVAMSAGWSGGAPEMDDENLSAPPEHLTAHAATGAIILAASAEPDRAHEVYRKFLETGVQIAQRKIQTSD